MQITMDENLLAISTHTTHVGGDYKALGEMQDFCISTHTTHVGGDQFVSNGESTAGVISTHTTHVGGDRL